MSEDRDLPWWQTGVLYQIYPRSFADSNGDGIGDLRGIIDHLDYLNDGTPRSLGVDGIWLSPIFPSPWLDGGYDVADYCAIAPEYGTLDDFRALLREAHARGIRVILDFVLNHTSHQHPWFVESRASRTSPKRDWYVWHDGRDAKPPNNWQASFGGGAWEWDEATQQFFLHSFLVEQPDVNWRNPEVQRAMEGVMRFWLDMGVDGFRLDVVNWVIKDAELRDNPTRLIGRRPYDRQKHIYDRNRPEAIDVARLLRRVTDSYPERMMVGEVWAEKPGNPKLSASFLADGEGLHLAFDFSLLHRSWNARAFGEAVDANERAVPPSCWPTWVLGNHDQSRILSRFGSEGRARVAAALLLTLRGTPFLYYGDEIGMRDGKLARSDLRDPVGIRYWPLVAGRDPARTPMQWSDAPQAGFTTGTPWLPVNRDHAEVNTQSAREDPTSMFAWHRALIDLRRAEPALHRGSYRRLLQDDRQLFGYLREHEGERIAVVLNFGRRARTAKLPPGSTWTVLLGVGPKPGERISSGEIVLPAGGVLVARGNAPQSRSLGEHNRRRSAASG